MSVCVLICTSGRHRNSSLSRSQAFSSKSKTTLATRCTYSRTSCVSTGRLSGSEMQGTRGRNTWARERVKAHTKRCREHITRRNVQHVRQGHDVIAEDLSDVQPASDELTVTDKLLIGELTVCTTPFGSTSTPKSSPASFSDVSTTRFCQLLFSLK